MSNLIVASLICESQLGFGLRCLRSFLECCQQRFSLVLFEDGSLTADGVKQVYDALPFVSLVRFHELPMEVIERISQFKEISRHRKVNPTLMKVLEIPIYLNRDFLFIDPDIIFLRKFHLQEITPIMHSSFVFMMDIKEAYSANIWTLYRHPGLRAVSRLNSGIMAIPRSRYDLEFVEWFLQQPELIKFPQVVEQTIWSAMSQGQRVFHVAENQIYCNLRQVKISNDTIAIHFPSYGKKLLNAFLESYTRLDSKIEAVPLRINPFRKISLYHVVKNALINRWCNQG